MDYKRFKGEIRLESILYFLALTIYLVSNFIVQTTLVHRISNIFTYKAFALSVAILLLLTKIVLHRRYLVKDFIIVLLIAILLVIVGYNLKNSNRSFNLITVFLLIVGQNGISLRRIFIYSTLILGTCIAITHGAYLLGFLPVTKTWQRYGVNRESLGYLYTSFSSNFMFHFSLAYIFIRKEKMRLIETIVISSIAMYFYQQTNTKSALAFNALLIIGYYIIKYIFSVKIIDLVNRYILIIGTVVPISLTYIYDANKLWMYSLNTLLTGRLALGKRALDLFGVSILGQKVEWTYEFGNIGTGIVYLFVDSSFLNISIVYGVIVLIVLLIGYYSLSKYQFTRNRYYMLTFSMLVLHSSFDPQFIELYYNLFLLLLGALFRTDKNRYLHDDFEIL
ncbi:hypothetical protein [Streptococcus fryi]